MIHEEICPYEVAKLAKEKGFDVPTDRYYHIYDDVIEAQNSLEMTGDGCTDFYNSLNQCRCAAPTANLLQRWLREVKGIHITLDCELNYEYDIFIYVWRIDYRDSDNRNIVHSKYSKNAHYTYELALKEAIVYALVNLI